MHQSIAARDRGIDQGTKIAKGTKKSRGFVVLLFFVRFMWARERFVVRSSSCSSCCRVSGFVVWFFFVRFVWGA